jgi:hypothetical protein
MKAKLAFGFGHFLGKPILRTMKELTVPKNFVSVSIQVYLGLRAHNPKRVKSLIHFTARKQAVRIGKVGGRPHLAEEEWWVCFQWTNRPDT